MTTFEVRVSIRNPGGELKTNMTANAEIILEEKKDVLMVPESAIVYDKERKPSLEVPDPKAEGGKRKVAVKLGISNGVKTEVVEGAEGRRQGRPAVGRSGPMVCCATCSATRSGRCSRTSSARCSRCSASPGASCPSR